MRILEGIVKVGIGVGLGLLMTNTLNAQVNHVSIGYGPMDFPSVANVNDKGEIEYGDDSTRGGTAYLSIGSEALNGGFTLFIGGDSRIQHGGELYGSGMVGLTGFSNPIHLFDGFVKIGGFAGIVGIQTYKKQDDIVNSTIQQQSGLRPLPTLKKTNIQPYGGIKAIIGPLEIQYAPASNMVSFGFVLYKG